MVRHAVLEFKHSGCCLASLNPHSEYPALPEQATSITPDAGCSACPLAQTTGHKSCDKFKLQNVPAVVDANRINLKELRQMQGRLHRRAFDADGIVGSNNGSTYDGWYYYNARKAINYAYFSSWNVTSVSGDTITVTTPDASSSKQVLYATWRERDKVIGLYWINGFTDVTCIQPLDMVEFQYPSIACNALKAKVLQVTASTATSLTLKLDKNVSSCVNFYPVPDPNNEGEFLPDPDYPTVKIYHYGRESENWMFIQEPHYLYGARKQKLIELADVPTNGIWILENAIIAPPENPLDPLTPYFVLEGHDGTQWVTINENNRLHIKPGNSVYSLKTTLPDGSIRDALGTDLTATYARFRATYYVETTQADSACRIVGLACHHHRKDYSNSVQNYGTTKGVSGNKYCSERVYPVHTLTDEYDRFSNPPGPGQDGIDDTCTTTYEHPTGIDNFPSGETAHCIQYGYCNKYVNGLDRLGDREGQFNIDYTMQFLRELWFATDKAQRQKYILSSGYDVERIMHPSILWFLDYYGGLITPHAWRAHSTFRGNGSWFPAQPLAIADASGNISLVSPSGLERGYLYDPVTGDVDHSRVGLIPANVSGFTTKRNPFDPNATVTDNLLEYIGCQVERDSGNIVESRGLNRISFALGQESILAPNFNVSTYGFQESSRATFQRDNTTGNAVVKIKSYRQEDKPEQTIGTRIIHKVTPKGNRRYEIEFENETKTFSRFDLGTDQIGDSYNKIFSVQAGGGPCILPYEPQALSSYEGYKNTGSRVAGAMPLDCIELPDGNRFVIESVTPHGGSEAETYGSRIISFQGDIGGFFQVEVNQDDDGNPYYPINIEHVKNLTDTVDMAVITDETKPVENLTTTPPTPGLLVNQTWFDGTNRFYFNSALNNNDYVEIKYTDSKPLAVGETATEYFRYHTITKTFTVVTQVDYSEWTNATTKTIYVGADAATVIVGGSTDPVAGEVRINDVSGKIHLTFSTDDSPSKWRIHLVFNTDAPEPDDDWCVGGNYKSFAKKRDIAVVIADGYNGTDYFASNTVVGDSVTFLQSASVFLPQAETPVYYTEQGVDNWEQIPAHFITPNAASGTITISNAFFAGFDPYGYGYGYGYDMDGVGLDFWNLTQNQMCFKITDIQMVDNRGQVPHSILTKTQSVLDSLNWHITSMGSGMGSDIGASKWDSVGFGLKHNDDYAYWENCYLPTIGETWARSGGNPYPDPYTPNYVSVQVGSTLPNSGGAAVENGFSASYSLLNTFGIPILLQNLPDGCTIEKSYWEISVAGLTRHKHINGTQWWDCDDVMHGDLPDDIYTLENLSYSIIGIKSADGDYDVIGTATGATDHTIIVDCTSIMQAMYNNRNSGSYPYGYGVLIVPDGFESGTAPSGPPEIWTQTGDCVMCNGANSYFRGGFSDYITWDGINIGRIAINIDYNDKDKLDIVQPRLPSMIDLD